jgi:acyl-CoA dehydrogenase
MIVQRDLALTGRARRVSLGVVARYADEVDRSGRFPLESILALKEERLLGVLLPVAAGGDGACFADVADICAVLGQSCSSTAMIFAMHQIQIASLLAFGAESDWHSALMRRIVAEQLLMASATSESGIGGDLRNSICAIQPTGDGSFVLQKEASVISYGASADGIFVTARRHQGSTPSDQVMAVVLKDQYTLEKRSAWDAMGMRGTCSDGFLLEAKAPEHQIFPSPFADIAAQSMLAASHVLWASLWYGIACGALMRAQAYVRSATKKSSTKTKPLGTVRLAEAAALLQQMRALVAASISQFELARGQATELETINFLVSMNNLKVSASKLAVEITTLAMGICGISGFRNDSPFSVGRYFRDAVSGPLMIANDRILDNVSNMLLIRKIDNNLLG